MLAVNETISGDGGVLVLGQEQDSPGGHFSAAESFRGQLTRFNIWSRFLNESDVNKVMNSCLEQIGDVVAWSDFYPGIHGFVQVTRGKSLLELWVTTFLPTNSKPLIFVRFISNFLCMCPNM